MMIEQAGAGIVSAVPDRKASSCKAVQPRQVGEVEPSRRAHGCIRHCRSGRALGMLQQEIRQALYAQIRLSVTAYAAAPADPSAQEVADQAVASAERLAEQAPQDATQTLVHVRRRVEQAVSTTRQLVNADEYADLDAAAVAIDEGLAGLEAEAASAAGSSASVLSVETRERQSSTIRIRTQEGDIVELRVMSRSSLAATDVALDDGESSLTATQVELSSRSRTTLVVEGELSEDELAAVQSVFAQAEAIADEFFSGDLAAAFDLASALEFDAEQLQTIDLQFRERVMSRASYAMLTPPAVEPVVEEPEQAVAAVEPPEGAAEIEAVPAEDVGELAVVEPSAEPDESGPVPVAADAISGFLDLLADFLGGEGGVSSFRYQYSESVKLEILKSVLLVGAPQESGEAAERAVEVVEAVEV